MLHTTICRLAFTVMVLSMAMTPGAAQQSPSFRISDHGFSNGGNPAAGINPESASFKVSLSSIGEPFASVGLASISFHTDTGFGSAYLPPGEVLGLQFLDADTLDWNGAPSATHFNLYRDALGALPAYGTCLQPDLPSSTADDTDLPLSGSGFFYLVTARNRLDEEGTLGQDSTGLPRPNTGPCP